MLLCNTSYYLQEIEQIQTSALKLASLRRKYQRRGRRAIHGIRTFINVDYENIRDARNGTWHLSFRWEIEINTKILPQFAILKLMHEWYCISSALEKFRQALDFAKYELKGAKTPEAIQLNNALYADALKNFQKQLYNVWIFFPIKFKILFAWEM